MNDGRTAHERYRTQLRALADEHFPRRLIDAGVLEPARGTWTRRFGRFLPDQDVYAVLVLADDERTVTVEVGGPTGRGPATAAGPVTVRPFQGDAALPGLRPLVASGDWHPVRYRPDARCVLRSNDGGRFAKVFGDDRGQGVHDDGVALHELEQQGALPVRVAAPVTFDPVDRVLVQATLPGAAARDALRTEQAVDMAVRMGSAIGAFTNIELSPVRLSDLAVHERRTRAYARDIARRLPHLAGDVDAFVGQLEELAAGRELRLCPVHGAPHAEQWLDGGDRLGLVDFDGLALGHVEMDLATWIGEVDFERRLGRPNDVLVEAFLAGAALHTPIDRFMVQVFRAHKQLAKVRRTAQALRVDGDTAAERHFETARHTVEQLRSRSARRS